MIPNPVTCCLFDMDGVLFNSMPLHEKSWKSAFREIAGMDYPTRMIYENEGRPGDETIKAVFRAIKDITPEDGLIREIYNRKTELMDSYSAAPVLTGMPAVIEFLADKQVKLCVVTGSSQKSLVNHINTHYNNRFGSNIITGADVKRGKPDPEPYLKAIEKTGCDVSNAIVIENAPLGVMSAKRAGIFTVAVNSGKLDGETLKNAEADIIVEDAIQLLSWLKTHC